MSSTKDHYLNTVLKEVRFPFDRKQIKKELEAHLEESIEFYLRPGINPEEAEDKATKDFGDPKEIGRMLNKVHKPLMGWLWLFSKYTLIIMSMMTVFLSTPRFMESIKESIETSPPTEMTSEVLNELSVQFSSTIFDVMVDQRIDIKDATLIIERAILTDKGDLIILVQQVDEFDLFGLTKEEYPLREEGKLRIDQTDYVFESDSKKYYRNFIVLIAKGVPLTTSEFKLEFDTYTEHFSLAIEGLNS